MKKKLLLILISISFTGNATDRKYSISSIPEELKKDVNVVIREDLTTFTIQSQNKASLHVYFAATILNENGKEYAQKTIGYDKLSKVITFKGTVYNANGESIKRLKNSDIYDQSAFDGFSLYSDNRLKHINLSQGSYPYTIEYEYEIEYKFLFFIPSSACISQEKVSSQHYSYSLVYPQSLKPRYKTFNVNEEPTITKTNDIETALWDFKNLKPIKFESNSNREEIIAQIMAAPTQFEFDTYAGKMTTWDDFGRWIKLLNNGRNVLPDETKQKIKLLTSGLKTREEKVKALYEFMQSKTRYVSIQLGIGGFQPFEASIVDQTGYGDCKALSNYMVAMLNEIGIKANYVLIRAGEGAIDLKKDFPSSQFNHAIAAVPNGLDTLWLECTSQTNPFGYMGTFTGDREALMITDEGAKIVNTINYNAAQNIKSRVADVIVQLDGNAKAKVKTRYSGIQYEHGHLNFTVNSQSDDQKKWIQKNIEIPAFDINSFKMTNLKDKIPTAIVDLDLTLSRLASVSGKRIFITPNLMNRFTFIPERVDARKTKVVLKKTYTDIDTIRYQLPSGIYPESVPSTISLSTRFGEYHASFKIDQGSLIYVRRVRMNKGDFPKESYNELIDFYKSINKADNMKLVFLNKT
jgi:transglutaminase-like putative cysteine protease